ncbi:MAG: Alpha-methylacyl-CoA racemase [uncultured Sphingomonas sp.]|uniref:Alpha-methylacyl-CoA racemase n=1 Tax=uncultured Sphingomonas sp. TaxID=158754 RepID=A0A6J4SEZ4_9SPHN|nr:CaiB/BaiF CoA-transferase family protein [uncultured Sphingomonas sp.]CAA9497188.1 MAG: Alpha-methylacyl-CoA racemase [uncultured Sphingomonas sp.]
MAGPLAGLLIVEMAGLGPGPFAATMLADHGARVIRIERQGNLAVPNDPLTRNRESIALDLKQEAGRAIVRRLIERADGLVEGYRPGVMEKLGLGPDALLQINPKLVYGRVTGWGQDGPLAQQAGHDINYLALTGLLSCIGEADRPPVPPLNLVADYGGGGLMLAFGMVAALLAAGRGEAGQVVDAAMTDGAALTGALIYGLRGAGAWREGRGANLLDGGDPLYACYECADGETVALGAVEPQFRRALLDGLGLAGSPTKQEVATAVATRPRDEWVEVFAGKDACVAPVLTLQEAPEHSHNRSRGTFIEVGGVTQPAPSPRFSRTATDTPRAPRREGEDGRAILAELGFSAEETAALCDKGVLR